MLVVLVCVGVILHSSLGVEGTTCDGYDCGVGKECFLHEVPCHQKPCPVIPACRFSCDVVICKEGFFCVEGQCVKDKCYGVKCREDFVCLEGECILEPTCDGVYCGCGQECYLQEVQCVKAPCPPIPTCREIDKCANVECICDATCVDGECVPLTCDDHECGSGEECYMEEMDCGCKKPKCRNKCDTIRCRKGFYCDNGQCVPNPTCKGVHCGPYEECYLQEVQCFVAPCPPVPTCTPADRCAFTLCQSGTYCDNGQCFPNPTCDCVDCGPNQECYLEEVVCVRSPCPPIPSCRPVEDCGGDKCALIDCREGYYCDDGQCIPYPSCDGVDCGPGAECYLEEVVCIKEPCLPIPSCRPVQSCPSNTCDNFPCDPEEECYMRELQCFSDPCPPPVPTCRLSCDYIFCTADSVCVDGQCVRICV